MDLFIEYACNALIKAGFVEFQPDIKPTDIPNKFFYVENENNIIIVNSNNKKNAVLLHSNFSIDNFQIKQKTSQISRGFNLVRCMKRNNDDFSSLKLAGKIKYNEDNQIKTKVFITQNPIAFLPTYNKEEVEKSNPVISLEDSDDFTDPYQCTALFTAIERCTGIKKSSIVAHDLYFIDSNEPIEIGVSKSIIKCSNIGKILSALAILHAIVDAKELNFDVIVDVFTLGPDEEPTHSGLQYIIDLMNNKGRSYEYTYSLGITGSDNEDINGFPCIISNDQSDKHINQKIVNAKVKVIEDLSDCINKADLMPKHLNLSNTKFVSFPCMRDNLVSINCFPNLRSTIDECFAYYSSIC